MTDAVISGTTSILSALTKSVPMKSKTETYVTPKSVPSAPVR